MNLITNRKNVEMACKQSRFHAWIVLDSHRNVALTSQRMASKF